MRIHLILTKNTQPVSFDYQSKMVGTIHKWLGKNELHNKTSLYSFSWLKNGYNKDGFLNFENGSRFFISFYNPIHLKQIIANIKKTPDFAFGMVVNDIIIQDNPKFDTKTKFMVDSPVLLKYNNFGKTKFYYYSDKESNDLLTDKLQYKLNNAGINSENVIVRFDNEYIKPSIKGITYKGIKNKGSICPIIIEGTQEQIEFAWNVGIGNSTGIGFGAISKME